MGRKFFALALALMIMAGLLPMSAGAASITESEVNTKLASAEQKWKNGATYIDKQGQRCLQFCCDLFSYVFGASFPSTQYTSLARFNSGTQNITEVDHLDGSSYTLPRLKTLLKKWKPGDVLVVYKAKTQGDWGHVMMIRNVTSDGSVAYIYDANWWPSGPGRSNNMINTNRQYTADSIQKDYSGAVTLYRYKSYADKTLTITFDPNGGSGSKITKTYSYFEGDGQKLGSTLPTVSRAGYTFSHWSTAGPGDYGGMAVNAQTEVAYITDKSSITLYAQWTQINCNGKHTKGTFRFYEAVHPHYNYWQCSVCGANFTDGSTAKMDSCTTCNPPCANGHSWGSWTTTKAASCGVSGSRKRSCSRCSEVETQTIAALSHNYQKTSFTAYNIFTCSNCKDSYRVDTVSWVEIPPSGNNTRSVGLQNSSDNELLCHFIVACYEEGRLVSLTEKSLRLPPSSGQYMLTPIPLEAGSFTWKVFVLDSNALTPILPELEY